MEVGIEGVLILRTHVTVDIDIHVVQYADKCVPHVKDVFAGYFAEVAVVEFRDAIHDLLCQCMAFFGQIDVVFFTAL